MWLELLVGAVTLLLLWDYLTRKRQIDMISYMPGPKTLPLLGNMLLYRGQTPEKVMDFIVDIRKKYGPIYRVWLLRQLAVFSVDPCDIEVILSSSQHITKNNLYELLHCWLGTGLLMSTGNKWHTRRKIITPTFHFKILQEFTDIFHQQSQIMATQLAKHADGKTAFNIYPFVCLAALDIIAETAMGTKINAQMNPQFPYVQAVNTVTNIMSERFIKIWQRSGWLFRLLKPEVARRQDESIKLMHEFTERIIEQRRSALQTSTSNSNTSPTKSATTEETEEFTISGERKRLALLDVLLQATDADGNGLSNADIREEVDTFMFEGHDTTTSGIAFCLYEISRHPAVQTKLFTEIREVLGDCRTYQANFEQLNSLKYLDCVIKESLRLHPPVPLIGRHFQEDVEIRGKRIPAGANFTVGIYVLLRDPDYFPEPDAFKPERFLNNEHVINPFAYIPFSAGPRNCIGQKFAMLEMKETISTLLRHYELLPLGPPIKPMMNIVLRSANGMHMGLQQRVYGTA